MVPVSTPPTPFRRRFYLDPWISSFRAQNRLWSSGQMRGKIAAKSNLNITPQEDRGPAAQQGELRALLRRGPRHTLWRQPNGTCPAPRRNCARHARTLVSCVGRCMRAFSHACTGARATRRRSPVQAYFVLPRLRLSPAALQQNARMSARRRRARSIPRAAGRAGCRLNRLLVCFSRPRAGGGAGGVPHGSVTEFIHGG